MYIRPVTITFSYPSGELSDATPHTEVSVDIHNLNGPFELTICPLSLHAKLCFKANTGKLYARVVVPSFDEIAGAVRGVLLNVLT